MLYVVKMQTVNIEECGPYSLLSLFSLLWETLFQISLIGWLGNTRCLQNIAQVLVLVAQEDDVNYDVNTFNFTAKRAVIRMRGAVENVQIKMLIKLNKF
jgi:hypothetical protein